MADLLATRGVRTMVAYPAIAEQPRTLSGSAAIPVQLDTELRTRRSRAAFAQFVRRENVKVVYLTDRALWSFWYRGLRQAGIEKIIVHDHTSGMRSGPTGLRAALKRLIVNFDGFPADVIVGVSDFVVARDIRASLIAQQRFRRVWNGIEPPSARGETRGVRSILGIPADIPVIGCACRATREKGVDVLFRAFARMAPVGGNDSHLVYIGDGPLFSDLNALRESLPCSDRIHMLGYRAGAADLLTDVTVCVVPSVWQEAFGLSVVEMMARQRPVIATRVGGIPEIIEDGSSGVLVTSGDVEELASALSSVCASPALQTSLGRVARERANNFFSSEQQVAAMIATFQDVFAN